MASRTIKRALISVYDKTGVAEFAAVLVNEFGVELISTGGSAALLKEAGLPVTLVEQVTGFPELMNGRVKTLHPKIHGAILADRDNPDHLGQLATHGIEPIDMVVVNLYPFAKTVSNPDCTPADAIEMIDIGGPCLLRAAAKNHRHVLVVSDVSKYELTLRFLRGELDDSVEAFQRRAAAQAFTQTRAYDAEVSDWLGRDLQATGDGQSLRYGENPHQQAKLVSRGGGRTVDLTRASSVHRSDKAMSFNNYLDANAALDLCEDLHRGMPNRSSCVFVKHSNPCGIGVAADPLEAYQRAYLGDPNAAMGGILACNFAITEEFADAVMETYARWGKGAGAGGFFVEVWLAPAFDEKAIQTIATTKKWGSNVRLLSIGQLRASPEDNETDEKKIAGGVLRQDRDTLGLNEDQWQVASSRTPSDTELDDLRLAWLVCKHSRSNAISICRDGMLIGNGAGQTSRVMSCRIATWQAQDNNHGDRLSGAVAASDAFFPFPDGVENLIGAGVTAIIQPGGSKRDDEVIKVCDERGAAMILTGTRHFKH